MPDAAILPDAATLPDAVTLPDAAILPDATTLPVNCNRGCTYEYEPICGLPLNGCGDPETFSNQCTFDVFNCENPNGGCKILAFFKTKFKLLFSAVYYPYAFCTCDEINAEPILIELPILNPEPTENELPIENPEPTQNELPIEEPVICTAPESSKWCDEV